jgi:NADH-quinone oxidoreductase subunit L
MTFYGPTKVPPEAGAHAHESPPAMVVPLVVLAIGSLAVGAYFEWTHGFAEFLVRTPSLAFSTVYGEHGLGHEFHWDIAGGSTVVALSGIGLAAFLYLGERKEIGVLASFLQSARGLHLYQLSYHKFFFDEIFAALTVWPLRGIALLSYTIDRYLVDGLVNLVGRIPRIIGSALRALQTGMVQFYALAMVLGLLVLMGTMILWQLA